LTSVKYIEIWFLYPPLNTSWYIDRTLIDVGKWVKVEVFVPDRLNPIVIYKISIKFWNGSLWVGNLHVNADINPVAWANEPGAVFLNGMTFEDAYGSPYYGAVFYADGQGATSTLSERGQTKNIMPGGYIVDPTAPSTMTFSGYYGCKKRIGFAIKMPPDDGQDSSTYGISQCKLKLEVYYGIGDSGFWGEVTYEFEDSTNNYYGLRNINKPYIALWHDAEKRANFIILPNTTVGDGLPSRLEVTADENQNIVKVVLGWASQKTGDLRYGLDLTDPTLDSDGDGIPDVIENIENYVGGLS
jgi:hypothetical protein